MRKDNHTRVIVLTSILVVLLIAGSIATLFYFKKNQKKPQETTPPPVAEQLLPENQPTVLPKNETNNQVPQNEVVTPAPVVKQPIKTPVSGPE